MPSRRAPPDDLFRQFHVGPVPSTGTETRSQWHARGYDSPVIEKLLLLCLVGALSSLVLNGRPTTAHMQCAGEKTIDRNTVEGWLGALGGATQPAEEADKRWKLNVFVRPLGANFAVYVPQAAPQAVIVECSVVYGRNTEAAYARLTPEGKAALATGLTARLTRVGIEYDIAILAGHPKFPLGPPAAIAVRTKLPAMTMTPEALKAALTLVNSARQDADNFMLQVLSPGGLPPPSVH